MDTTKEAKHKYHEYRGMFETQKSGNKTSLKEIGLNIRTLASPKVGQDQVSREVSVQMRIWFELCCIGALVQIRTNFLFGFMVVLTENSSARIIASCTSI